MKYLKSTLAGFASTILIYGVIPMLAVLVRLFVLFLKGLRSGGFGFAFGPVQWHAPGLTDSLFMLSAFGLGFFWSLWRFERRQLSDPPGPTNAPVSPS